MGQLSPLPGRLERQLARLGRSVDRLLPKRFRGRLVRLVNGRGQRFLIPELAGPADLLRSLQDARVVHAVLAEATQHSPLMVLIDDENTDAVRRLLSYWPTGEAVNVYSTTGPQGFSFGDMPLLAPRLARRVLSSATQPDSHVHRQEVFLAKLYRYAFLGARAPDAGCRSQSGLLIPPTLGDEARAHGLELAVPVGLEEIADLLETRDWSPPLEILERIGTWNPFVARRLAEQGGPGSLERPGLALFYVRQRAVDLGFLDRIGEVLEQGGFQLLHVESAGGQTLTEIAEEVRGGNWGRGPFPVSGGPPCRIIIAFDPRPIRPRPAIIRRFPLLDNERIQATKQAVRETIAAAVQKDQHFNALHSTDNATQAWRALRRHYPDEAERLYRHFVPDEDQITG